MSRPWSTLNKSRGKSTHPRKHSIREFSMFTRANSALPLGIIAPLPRLQILKAIPGTGH